MGKYVIIDCKYGVSKINEYLYNKNLSKKLSFELTDKINVRDKEIEVRKIPIANKINKKTLVKFVSDLKKDNVSRVILSENARKNEEIYSFLKNNLEFCSGKKVVELYMEEIYKKYLILNNKKEFEAELVLFSDNPQVTYNFLRKICRKLKNVYIVAENYESFDSVIRKIYDEFGFYIYFTEKITNVFLKDRIYINLAQKTDFINFNEEKNNIIILNLCGNSITSGSFLNTFAFGISAEFKEVVKYFKYSDQECIEFLATALNDGFSSKILERFINEYNVKLKKICLKNY